jgi:formylglycine-generating enzyme required for sulfatase activity
MKTFYLFLMSLLFIASSVLAEELTTDTFDYGALSIDFVTVGDPGNAGDAVTFKNKTLNVGQVDYGYRIGKYEITNAMWYYFEQVVTNGSSSWTLNDNKPVAGRTLGDAMRFVNMLHNLATNGSFSTESGVYKMGNPALGQSPYIAYMWDEYYQWENPDGTKNPYRHKDAKYFLPSRDEWYKAAYYKGGSPNVGYWDYATQSDILPITEGPSLGSNSANYGWMSSQGPGTFTDVGSYPNSVSAYGTLDQNGNASEWTEPTINGDIISSQIDNGSYLDMYGGNWYLSGAYLRDPFSNSSFGVVNTVRIDQLGFRVASVKESVTKAPVFSLGGKYLTSPTQAITITCETPGAKIYYTTNGSFPTTNSRLYTVPVTVSNGTTLKAIAVGIDTSPVTMRTFIYSVIRNELTRGHYLLIERGLQLQAWTWPLTSGGSFNLTNWELSNFTTINSVLIPYSYGGFYPSTPPGLPWSRVLNRDAGYVMNPMDTPFLSNLVSLQISDEQNLTPANIASIASEIATLRAEYPEVILHTNQYGSQSTATQLRSYMQTAQPDMLMFDTYPFDGSVVGGSPTIFYEHMQKYRLLGLAGNDGTGTEPIPCALFTQTYTGEGMTHVASESEVRLNEFSAWAFGYKFVCAFLYGDPNYLDTITTLFTDGLDDYPTAQFYQVAETNRQSRNLGPALVRLISTDVRMIMGKHGTSGTMNATPSGVDDDLDNIAGDSYLTSASVTAHPTGINNNQPGDVIIGFFKPLHESFDGTAYSNQKYFMVVNGLSDATAGTSATQQTIRLTFNFGSSGITSLQRLSRTTGKVETVSLVSDGGGVYHLDLTLDGGTGDLFKYKTGALFVGVVLAGDFNNDYVVNATDIDLLSAAINSHSTNYATYDLTKDGLINSADMDYLIRTILHTYYGDADLNGSVGVSDLSVLAAYYNTASGASWANGDFDGNGAVGVSDLSILAANYNSGSASTVSWAEAYAQAFGTTSDAETSSDEATADEEDTSSTICSSLGLSLIAGLAMLGLMLVKMEE